jgi:hypothetical protein
MTAIVKITCTHERFTTSMANFMFQTARMSRIALVFQSIDWSEALPCHEIGGKKITCGEGKLEKET